MYTWRIDLWRFYTFSKYTFTTAQKEKASPVEHDIFLWNCESSTIKAERMWICGFVLFIGSQYAGSQTYYTPHFLLRDCCHSSLRVAGHTGRLYSVPDALCVSVCRRYRTLWAAPQILLFQAFKRRRSPTPHTVHQTQQMQHNSFSYAANIQQSGNVYLCHLQGLLFHFWLRTQLPHHVSPWNWSKFAWCQCCT